MPVDADVMIEDDPTSASPGVASGAAAPDVASPGIAPGPAGPAAAPPADDSSALIRAAVAAQRADDMQRQREQPPPQQPQPMTIAQYIDGLDVSGHKKGFLKQHPEMLQPSIVPVMAKHYRAGLLAGLEDDTPELDQFVLANVAREIEHQRELTSADARPTAENRQAHQQTAEAVEDLQREAEAILAETETEQRPAPPAPRRSIPFSAPVSREVPMASGEQRPGQITLSAEERQIAHSSFKHLPKHAAEVEYAANKRKMLAMKADGRIQGDR